MPMFDLDNYTPVADRITQFWKDYPEGRILTEMIHVADSGKQFVVQAMIYVDRESTRPVATGLAEEHFLDRGPNQTSPLENAETSAIGRALCNFLYSSTAADRPSREEMEKVNRAGVPDRVKVAASGGKISVTEDERWTVIEQGAAADPTNTFLSDIVKKGKQYGTLSEKQMAAAFNAALKSRDAGTPRTGKITQAFPGATELQDGEEMF